MYLAGRRKVTDSREKLKDKNLMENRNRVIAVTSALGIVLNLIIATVKILAGLAVGSIAVVSEGVNNAADVASSLLAYVGVKLAAKHPTAKHPFGYGRIEYFTSLIIAVLIMLSGFELFKESVELIFRPQELKMSYLVIAIVAVTAVIKLLLGVYTIRTGKRINSDTLVALGVEGRNDSFVSLITIISALVFIISGVSIDAYAGVLISGFILKAGFDVVKGPLSALIGSAGDYELAEKIYNLAKNVKCVENVADMKLHNYGPDKYSGTMNVEIDHAMTVGDVYHELHDLQLRIMHELGVTMVFGVYAVGSDHEEVKAMRREIAEFVKGEQHIKSFHALYFDESDKRIYCDFTVDYDLKDWDSLRIRFEDYIKQLYPSYTLELVIETDFV